MRRIVLIEGTEKIDANQMYLSGMRASAERTSHADAAKQSVAFRAVST
jgi:hypothetical protein